MMNALEQRIQKLEDLEAIRTLQATYGHYVDKGWNGKDMDIEKLTDIFTEDALWEAPAAGVLANGHKEIIESFKSFDEKINSLFIVLLTPLLKLMKIKRQQNGFFFLQLLMVKK
ncbi:nuclear transport factor 2 family protein [Thalassotalea piscium]